MNSDGTRVQSPVALDVASDPQGGGNAPIFQRMTEAVLQASIVDRFEEVAVRCPQRIAVRDEQHIVTYQDLAQRARALSVAIASATAGREGPVALLVPPDARLPAAILGILGARRCCVSIDPDHPPARNRVIASHSAPVAVVAPRSLVYRLKELFDQPIPLIDVDVTPHGAMPPASPTADDHAFIIYTSGSTGTPKGVYQNHRGLLQDVMTTVNLLEIGPGDVVTMLYSPSLIAGVKTMFNALLTGATTCVLPPTTLGAAGIAREVRAQNVTIFSSSPTLFKRVVDTLAPDERFERLRVVLFGGERVEWSDVDVFKRGCAKDARLGIHLSSTECWALQTFWFVDDSIRSTTSRPPVGREVSGRRVTLLDEEGMAVTDGEVGESVVRSKYVALGYWKDELLTQRSFASDRDEPGVRSFRTGDLLRRRPDGLFEYVGRRDEQIKIGGRRVEPNEVEFALKMSPAVKDAAVVAHRNEHGSAETLIAYVELSAGCRGLFPHHLRWMVSQRVPGHMVPPSIVIMESLPRLANFKIDRRQLSVLAARLRSTQSASTDGVATAIAQACGEVLGVTGVATGDSFAALGGDSMQAATVAAKLGASGIHISPDVLYTAPSIAVVARGVPSRDGGVARAAGAAAHVGTQASRSSASSPGDEISRWTSRIDKMLRDGDFDRAQSELDQLSVVAPSNPYGHSLSEVLRKLPKENELREPFHDDGTKDVQISRLEGSDTAVFVFSGTAHAFGVPYPMAHRWLGQVPATIVYLNDVSNSLFANGVASLGGSRQATLSAMRGIAASVNARHVGCCGTSAGCLAALHYGIDLGARSVLSLAGPTKLANIYGHRPSMGAALRDRFPDANVDLRHEYARSNQAPRAILVYGEHNWDDRLHAEYMADLPTVDLLMLDNYTYHNVVLELLRRGWLERLLNWMLAPDAGLPLLV